MELDVIRAVAQSDFDTTPFGLFERFQNCCASTITPRMLPAVLGSEERKQLTFCVETFGINACRERG
ncbi:hypothetical protein [Chitinasiproducens palmae]|uniref:Uncharacterized protein n=1 Tax=Chitinasiproducens palmae TaxID=1770053 RepID=A0A1H2PIL1_9BURK|nr:hypothetical protein [Chitinasiproducens palmae]SDV46091.1 hypothetical protein SAMN05216551_10167 [Chitinasiproducens palmae]